MRCTNQNKIYCEVPEINRLAIPIIRIPNYLMKICLQFTCQINTHQFKLKWPYIINYCKIECYVKIEC